MRATVTDVICRRATLADWWFETPWKRPRNWWTLLTMQGRGWLRWGWGIYSYVEVVDPWLGGPTHEAGCAPPLRRLAEPIIHYLKWFARGGGWMRFPEGPWPDADEEWVRIHYDNWGRISTRGAWTELRDPEWPDGYLLS